MAEPTTSLGTPLAAGFFGLSLASIFPGVDLAAVVGAFGGAFAFIIFAKDLKVLQRLGYLFVGWIGGYFGAVELLAQKWAQTSGFAAFIAGLICVVVCISVLEAIQTGRPPKWLLFILNRFFGKRDTQP
ncbi:putative holin [Pseudomonas luteola]|uniref:putative holin n=1 Tax=Pseudomonas luteola TaxID=47886 RepID=UPI000366A4B1|nr:putative holin [Pseudomonas luteola]